MAVRVLIVDDSRFVRDVLRDGLSRFPDIVVVGEASDGRRAQRMVAELRPDVVTMDVLMPMVDGMTAIRAIMDQVATPIVVVADARDGVEKLALQAIEAGAIEVFPKPRGGFDADAAAQLADILRTAAAVRMSPRSKPRPRRTMPVRRGALGAAGFIGIVASTGGPQTVLSILRALPRSFAIPIALVQHTADGFTHALGAWLDAGTAVKVQVARAGQRVMRGQVAVAPDGAHMQISPGGIVRLVHAPPISSHRPSGTVLLSSLASAYGPAALGIVCTGMGRDGADGLSAIEAAGGLAMVEDPATAVLDSMPRAAIAATRTAVVAPAAGLGELLRGARPERRP